MRAPLPLNRIEICCGASVANYPKRHWLNTAILVLMPALAPVGKYSFEPLRCRLLGMEY